jgi:hypothetical protein
VISEPALRICRLVDAACTALTGFACAYFDGALAEAPASARSNGSADPERITSAPTTVRHLDIASSIWFGTTQTKQNCRLRKRLLSRWLRMISSPNKRNPQSWVAGKISNSIYRPKIQQRLCRNAVIPKAAAPIRRSHRGLANARSMAGSAYPLIHGCKAGWAASSRDILGVTAETPPSTPRPLPPSLRTSASARRNRKVCRR